MRPARKRIGPGSPAPVRVAVIGSGPAAFFTVEALLASGRDVEVDVIERLPVPFGLVRFGVAPDHAVTKRVADTFEAIAAAEQVAFHGNVEVGRDITVAELLSSFDAVVLAAGAPTDVPLPIPGVKKNGVYGAAQFVGWYNGHPDYAGLAPRLDTTAVAVVGMGNVALDIARILVRTPAELACTDMVDHAIEALIAATVRDVYIVGRRGPLEARFTPVELREMGNLRGAMPVVDARDLPEPDAVADPSARMRLRNLNTFWGFARARDEAKELKRVHFVFGATPREIRGRERVGGLHVTLPDGSARTIACGVVISAIGFRPARFDGVPTNPAAGTVVNVDGRVAPGLYVAGWMSRGSSGVIGTNKPDGASVAVHILSDFQRGSGKPGRVALLAALNHRGVERVTYEGWVAIDGAERTRAREGSLRGKFATVAEMLAAAKAPLHGAERELSLT